jgi:hypothetical protein
MAAGNGILDGDFVAVDWQLRRPPIARGKCEKFPGRNPAEVTMAFGT